LKAKTDLPVPIPVTVERIEFEDREVARIRDAYARRQHGPQDSYSFLNPSYVLMVQERESALCPRSPLWRGSLEGKRVLEIGCGTGYWLRAFLQWGALPENVFGIDCCPKEFNRPKALSLRCSLGVRSATALTFPEASFRPRFTIHCFIRQFSDLAMRQCIDGKVRD